MAYDAKVVQVMLASPGDVKVERTTFLDVITEWNSINSFSTGIVLLPRTWELDVAPQLGTHPQDLINNRILDNADLLVAAFWSRIGTPTKRAKGGAVEEVKLQLRRKKPILLYFSDAPSPPSDIDPEQLRLLRDFKAWARDKGLYRTYTTATEFSSALLKHIHFALHSSGFLMEAASSPLDESPLKGLKTFPQELLVALNTSATGRAVITKQNEKLSISVDGRTAFASDNEKEHSQWVSSVVSLLGRGLLRDVTRRGEVFELTDAGRTVAGAK